MDTETALKHLWDSAAYCHDHGSPEWADRYKAIADHVGVLQATILFVRDVLDSEEHDKPNNEAAQQALWDEMDKKVRAAIN